MYRVGNYTDFNGEFTFVNSVTLAPYQRSPLKN